MLKDMKWVFNLFYLHMQSFLNMFPIKSGGSWSNIIKHLEDIIKHFALLK
jgi:hypothetical protein